MQQCEIKFEALYNFLTFLMCRCSQESPEQCCLVNLMSFMNTIYRQSQMNLDLGGFRISSVLFVDDPAHRVVACRSHWSCSGLSVKWQNEN